MPIIAMKRTIRVASLTKILTSSPSKLFPLSYFCDYFDAAKSTISEDIAIASEGLKATETGYIETVAGIKGGVKFVPHISDERLKDVQEKLAKRISDPNRILGGGFLYTSDIMFDTNLVSDLADIFVRKFKDLDADYIATVETKGIPLSCMVAHKLNLPLVIIRREAKVSEGSTVSINYFSGSYDRIQRMSLSKRSVTPSSKAIIIDDFMRGGGSIKGIEEILGEFDVSTVGVGVAMTSATPEKKLIENYTAILYLGNVDEQQKTIEVYSNNQIFL